MYAMAYRKVKTWLLLIVFPVISSYAQVQSIMSTSNKTADEIISAHIEAIGGLEHLNKIQNIFYSSNSGAQMSVGRPYFKLVGDKHNPGSYMEGYDGAAWEWFEDPGIVIRTVGKASEAIRHYAGVERPLINYKEKGSKVKLIGEVEFDHKPAFVLQLVRRDKFIEKFYIDQSSFLVLASSYEAPLHAFGQDITTLTRFSNYLEVGGVKFAHRFESVELPSGKDLGSVDWNIVVNRDIPEDWFSPPSFKRTPLQKFIEQLYNQRDDIEAVMWTYHEFRLANKHDDTSDPVNIAAYQMLKMGQIQNAISLLEQNAIDNPESASTRFGLGRAYRSSGQLQKARLQFLEALRIDPEYRRAREALEGL